MNFVDAVAVVRRHKLLVVYGLLARLPAGDVLGLPARRTPASSAAGAPTVPVDGRGRRAPGRRAPDHDHRRADDRRRRQRRRRPRQGRLVGRHAGTTTTVAVPPLAPLSAVIDSRAMYYTALSLKTDRRVAGLRRSGQGPRSDDGRHGDRRRGPGHQHDGRRRRRLDAGPSPRRPCRRRSPSCRAVVAAYSATPATRFGLDGVVISAPSASAGDDVDQGAADVRHRPRGRARAVVVPHPRRRRTGAASDRRVATWRRTTGASLDLGAAATRRPAPADAAGARPEQRPAEQADGARAVTVSTRSPPVRRRRRPTPTPSDRAVARRLLARGDRARWC